MIPKPHLLETRISILLKSKDILIENTIIKPFDSFNEVKKVIMAKLAERGDPIFEWGWDLEVYLKGPLALEEVKGHTQDEEEMRGDDVNSMSQVV